MFMDQTCTAHTVDVAQNDVAHATVRSLYRQLTHWLIVVAFAFPHDTIPLIPEQHDIVEIAA